MPIWSEARVRKSAQRAAVYLDALLRRPGSIERGALSPKQRALRWQGLLLEGAVEQCARLVEVPERRVQLGVGGEGVGVAREELALGNRVELVEPGDRAAEHSHREG